MERIPVSGPWITRKEIDYVTDAVTNAWYGNANGWHDRFEKAFADYVGVRHAISLPHCTSAIHLALLALDVGPGDEVIVPEITWIASAAPISYVGATAVFADVDSRTWCLDAAAFDRCVTPRTRAVIPVDLYGNMPDMDALGAVAKRHQVAMIEDAAEAIGSEFGGRKAGSFGETGVFSFHGSKTLTTGEGGMLVTNRDDIRDRVLRLRDHGRAPGDRLFCNTEVAYKYKMSSMQAALGAAQLERISELVGRKREIFSWYADELSRVDGISLNYQAVGTLNSYWMVTMVFDQRYRIDKTELLDVMAAKGIDCRPFFHPLSSLPAYAGSPEAALARERNTVSYGLSPRAINLPSALSLTREQVARVCTAAREALGCGR
ncbi:MAG: DegT/DnrJ/EryC1/StrS family aminotransferase [Acidobacteriota bacterium]|nr:DegT/DnrJ/EryC1/StrS family aminotransferase [Acidobacteriota bacterium]